jgi:hypothetical protein
VAQTTLNNYQNNLFSNHFLEERIQGMDEWQKTDFEEKFEDLRELYQKKREFLTENLNEDQTQDNFIDPVLRKLGHDWVTEASKRVGSRTEGKNLNPDYAFMDSSEKLKVHRDNEEPLEVNYAVGDAKAWNRKLDKSSQDHTNPAFQIYNYVDRLRADWGILTNGKKWRLYSYEKCAADIYFEVDLEEILAGEKTDEKLEAFKYFYLFFRAESFEGDFLDQVYQESVNFAEGLEDDLEDKVYNALEVAVEGFFQTNDLEKTEKNIDLVHHASLIFLYRILFILNAESRDLLPTDDKAYQQAFGLMELKQMIVEEEETHIFQETTVAWDNRISRLFEGIDEGYPLDEDEIPAYNGGLFDKDNGEENKFLAENKLYGSYIKEILELLATSYDEEKEKRIILDYKDLNIRHLGSVYEGLLEHKFKAADERKILKNGEWTDFSETDKDWEEFDEEKRVEENELYLTNESGERKATGSYYTPEYIVEYIVENTVGPKVEEKIEAAEENGDNVLTKILELNVCDPAMGSGHFLTEATEFIAEHIVEHADLEEQDIDENEDELNWAKRQVVQNCIYGVDVNELAVELGKLSLWIETMAEGKPLNFLDHHLKHGNSLIGSDFDEIFSHPTEDQKKLDSDRFKFGDPQEIKENFQEQYLEIEQMPENKVEQIHEKEQSYKQFIQENVLYQQFNQLANIHTRQYFEKEANSSDYESFLINIGNPGNPFENTEWYKNAQQDAENRNYFHWQLEFPKVFFGQTQGFDAVIGNPPYGARLEKSDKDYFEEVFSHQNYQLDTYLLFLEKCISLIHREGLEGMIVPNTWLSSLKLGGIRNHLLSETSVQNIRFYSHSVFEDATVDTLILILENGVRESNKIQVTGGNVEYRVEQSKWRNLDGDPINIRTTPEFSEISEKLEKGEKLDNICKITQGTKPFQKGKGSPPQTEEVVEKKPYVSEKKENSEFRPLVNGGRIGKYITKWEGDYWIKFGDWLAEPRRSANYGSEEKLLVRQTGDSLIVAYDDEQLIARDNLYTITENDSKFSYKSLTAILNSKLLNWYYQYILNSERGEALAQVKRGHLAKLPVLVKEKKDSKLSSLAQKRLDASQRLEKINTDIQDYIGNYSDGKTLGDLYTPAEGLSDEVVSDTSADRDSLRIGGVEFEERNGELILKVSARYKPDDSENIDEDELDRWGYFETEKVPAMRFDVDEKLRPLIEEFVSLAVDEAGGFAGFRESATKTNSVIDRLEKLTLPKLEDVEQGLEKFIDNREEAEELEEEIQETDELIDAIVFDLYDLTEEEVETVLDSLDTSEAEKERILQEFRGLDSNE